ncbi:HAMP domain-containing sensor histidine kinase [Shouchella sp. 1P09AA]|uniref:sensor histidine kinase n=1 Tax=unclassified Shouchella TaxID=2893065 RepID=UPI00399F2EEA
MRSLYVRVVLTIIGVMALSSLFSFVLTNVYYQLYLKPENSERITEVAEEVQRFLEENLTSDEQYLNHIGQLGYQMALFVDGEEPQFYGGSFRDEQLPTSDVQRVMLGQTYNGVGETSGQLFVTGFFNNELRNTVGVPVLFEDDMAALFLRPNVEQQLGEFRSFLAVLVVFILLFSVLVVFVSTRYLVAPIEQLTRATKKMEQAEFELELPTKRKDEIGQLANHFSSMAQTIERQERLRREFVANVSHEIQSPLTTIQGMTHALKHEERTDLERKQYVEQIELESKRLSSLSRQLLTLASLEHGELNRNQCRVAEQWMDIVRTHAFRWREKELFVQTDFAESLIVEGDEQLLYQVWLNLFTNAVKFSKPEGTIRINGYQEDQDVIVKVEDNGEGISPEALPKIFERFYKEDQSRTSKKESNGLGLAIVHEIVTRHGGMIDVTSEKGVGTTFIVRLPRKKV